ncbi:Ankyrin repeat and SOCS box protein 2 [Nibea albiflora]|uniref:Ankyrin repeat and SOCS box protein 2 n=1 Tax=Nibea albiflora TaxID=240163 RepID=A0ACB7FG30_NIBAL|nr:Ankyrin repeat and SOCS box protein 2 [Nibea albiflora]
MTKFSYSEYLSQFRNAGGKCSNVVSRLRGDRRRGDAQSDITSEPEDVDPVVFAIRRGDLKALNDLATSAAHHLQKEDKDGWIPLHHAAFCGQTECLKILLRGADPDISSKNKETPLYKACELENVDMVSLILSYGATVNQRCGQGWTALHEAVSRNNTEICEILIRAGASINPPNTYSITPLIVAAQRGQMRALCYLIGKGADVNIQTCDGVTALHEASKNGHKESVAVLLTKNADANKPANSGLLPLHFAAQYGHHEIVSLLVPVTSRARLRQSCISPLHLAAEHNRHTVAAVLLKTGADVNATLAHSHSVQYADQRATALYFAIANGSTETAEVLLNAGASLSLDPVSPLLMACLLDNGCDALSCFKCTHGSAPHPTGGGSDIRNGSNGYVFLLNENILPLNCSEPRERETQFCEWISTSVMCKWAGPIIDLLLEHVGHVQLCSKLTELLDIRDEWLAVKRKSSSPRPLLHLCRLKIRSEMGRHRLKSLTSLPLPNRLIRYLNLTE